MNRIKVTLLLHSEPKNRKRHDAQMYSNHRSPTNPMLPGTIWLRIDATYLKPLERGKAKPGDLKILLNTWPQRIPCVAVEHRNPGESLTEIECQRSFISTDSQLKPSAADQRWKPCHSLGRACSKGVCTTPPHTALILKVRITRQSPSRNEYIIS